MIVNLDAQVTAREAQDWLKTARVCRHTIAWWRATGRIKPVGRRGRSPLYRWGDVLAVEHAARSSPLGAPRSSRCRSCDRAAERERELQPA